MRTTAELFGENLRNQLYAQNKTQADIARHLKVTEASVSRWVNGTSVPRSAMIDKQRLKRLNDIYLMGNISEAEYREKSAELQKIIADLSKQEPVKGNVFTENWKDVYQMLDDSHKRSFWRNLIKGVRLDENMKPVEIMY